MAKQPSPADSGLYLVPYWVRAGRLWIVILFLLVLGGVVVPILLSTLHRSAYSRGIGYGAAATLCGLVDDGKTLQPAAANAQLNELQASFTAVGAIDPAQFDNGVSKVADALEPCAFLKER